MPLSVKVTDNLNIALTKAKNLGSNDFRTAFRRTANAWLQEINSGFLRERDPFGNPWKKLHPVTVIHKTASGSRFPNSILRDSDEFRRSFKAEISRTGLGIFTDHVFDDGTGPEIHQFGGTHPRTNSFIPARPFLPIGAFPAEWWQIAEGYIQQDLKEAFRAGT